METSMDSFNGLVDPAELIKLHSKVAYHRDQCDSDGALQVQAMLVQRVGIKESPEGTPPDAVLRGPFRRSESIGLQSARKPKQVNSIGGETDDDSVDTKQNENGSDEGEDKNDTENRDEDLLPLSIPFTGAWFEDDQFNTEYKPKGSQKLRGLRFHQWENMAGSKFYQLQAEAKDVDPGSYFVSFLCCKHSWDTSPSVNEPSAIQVSTSVKTPDFVGALPYTATRRVPLASYLKTNEWGHIVGGVVAVPIGAAGTVRATLHAEEQGWWRSGLITHSMVLTKLSDGQAQPILQPTILKSEPTFNTNAFLLSTSKAKDVSSRGDDNRVEDDDDVSRISNTSASPNSSTTMLGGTPMPSKLFESTMSPVVGAEGGVVTRVDSQSKLEILELQRQVWRSQEQTRHTREKLDVALASMNDVTSERRARESKAREERLIEVRALRDEIDRLQNEVEESRDLEKRYSSIEAQLRKSESEARRQGDRAFKALKEDQILRSNLEDARRDASESRVVCDNLTMKNNELRSNLDSIKAQHNELKLVADADRSRLEGIIADTEVLLKEKEELLAESKEEEQKKANLHQDAEKRLISTENQLLKQQKMILAAQHQLKIFESGQAASSPVGKSSGGGGSGTRSLDDASAKQMDGLLSFLTTMTTDRGFDSILFEVAEKGASILSAAHIIVFKVDRQGRSMFAWGGDEDFTVPYRGAKGGLAAKCASECQPMRVDDVASDSRAVAHEKEFEPRDNEDDEAVPTKSIMCTPVTYFDEDEEESAAAVIEYYNKLDQNGKAIPFTLRDEIIAGKIATVLGSCIKSDDLVMDVIMEEDEEDEEDDDEPEKEKTPEQLKRDLTKANLKIAELERKIENLEKNGVVGTKKVQKSGPPSRAARKKKGQAIIQRSVSIETGKLVEIKRYEKDDLAQNLILNTLKKNPIYCKFENCTPNELDQVVGAFEPLDVPKGVNLITQGEKGDYFYIIESGTFKILINLPDGTQKQVAIFKPGQGVGELALIQDAPRAATVKAACVARVWRLKRENCDIVTFLRKKRNERCIKYMGSIKIPAAARASILGTESNTAATDCTLKDLLSESEIDGLVAQLTEEVFEPGVCIMQQGQRGDELFIIEEGVVDILIANAEELKTGQLGKKVAEIKDGTVFGEKALLGGDKRNASCVAQTRIKAFRLAREDFEKAIGSLAELLGKQGGPGEAVALSPGTAIRYEEIPVRELQNIQITKDLTIVKTLGQGTFGRVSLAKHNETGELYALKAQAKASILEGKMEDRVLLEKKTLIRLDCEYISTLIAVGQDSRQLYYLLEYLPGGELYTHLGKVERFSERDAQFFIAQLTIALEHIHKRSIIYRDLKPENICIDKQGYVKLVDFGMAKLIKVKTWTFCGTPDYLAPEIVQQKGHDRGVDYWALGVVAYELVHGVPPFCDESGAAMKVYKKIVDGDLIFPDTFSSNLKEFCENLMTINVGQRLGMLKSGCEDIKRHKWFTGFNYTQLQSRTLESPVKLDLETPEDTKYFEIDEASIEAKEDPAEVDWVADLESNDIAFET